MGEVKRYDRTGRRSLSGARVDYDDYARLERERDYYKAFHDGTMPVLESAQGLRNRLEATERAMAAQADELTRLRAVEAAAQDFLNAYEREPSTHRVDKFWFALAEALGATSAVDRECDRGRKG